MGVKKRVFQKFFTRAMPLINIQYWYRGERYRLPEVIDRIYFDPLFIFQKSGMTDVYYEPEKAETSENKIVEYFSRHKKKFKDLVKAYLDNCSKIELLCEKKDARDLKKIFYLVSDIWPMITISMVLGESNQEALDLRSKYGEVEYLAAGTLIDLLEQKYPLLGDFVNLLTFEEITSGSIPSSVELGKRRRGFIYFEDKLYRDLPAYLRIKEDKVLRANVLQGLVANKGKVRGKARVLLTPDLIDEFMDGEILVSSMTTPEFLPAMKKALAFVTDEGGITSHAAIVSRELNIPCIVGTKVATEILKTGDLVEVDAEKGVVRKLKNAK